MAWPARESGSILTRDRSARSDSRRLLSPLLLAIFVRALPLTMFGPLLPQIARSLGAGLAEIGWIVATYATGSLLAQPIMGRISDARGRRTVLLACIAMFAAGSVVCALATSLWVLVGGRIVQSLGAGGIQPIITAMIGDRLPESQRGGALGSLYGVFGLGTVVGALLGGVVVDGALWLSAHAPLWAPLSMELASYPWHLVFWVNVALAAAAYGAVSRLPADDIVLGKKVAGLDGIGIALIAGFTLFLMAAATSGTIAALWFVGGAVGCLLLLVYWERRASAPLFDPTLFSEGGPALLFVVAFLFGVPSFTLTIYSATYFIAQFGASEAQSGLALFVLALLYVVGAVVGGRGVRTLGAKPLLIGGLLLTGGALAMLASVTALPAVVAAMAIGGFGLGLASAPPNVLILAYVPAQRSGAANGIATMLATSGSITAPAVVSAFLRYSGGSATASFRAEFWLSAVACATCIALSASLPGGKRFENSKDTVAVEL